VILALFSIALFFTVLPVVLQLSRTLTSIQNLVDTINDDLEPTVKEINQSVAGIKNILKNSTTLLKSSLKEASVVFISSAYGLMTGIKDYLSNYKTTESSYNGKGNAGTETLASERR